MHGYKNWGCEQERIYVITQRECFDHVACARVNFDFHTHLTLPTSNTFASREYTYSIVQANTLALNILNDDILIATGCGLKLSSCEPDASAWCHTTSYQVFPHTVRKFRLLPTMLESACTFIGVIHEPGDYKTSMDALEKRKKI